MAEKKTKMVVITEKELSKVPENLLNKDQLNVLLMGTPENAKYTRPAKGGGTWTYVTGTYVKKVLNMLFGWDWDFEVVKFEYNMDVKQCIVLGKLTVRTKGHTVVKNQFGRSDIKFKKNSTEVLDLGNDLKAATTDALKKCASELGVASDVYGANEFKKIKVIDAEDATELDDETILIIEQCTERTQLLELVNSIEYKPLENNVNFKKLVADKLKELI
jgi:hypothetical protein